MTDTSIYTDPTNMTKDNVQLSIWNGTKWVELSNGLTINQINANIGAVQDAVKDAQSGIAQATADAQNAVDTANDTATKVDGKVDDTTYQSGIAQLASDINLRVKSDDLLSQINIESGNILIQSNKIFLDASSVTFGGTAFITSAMVVSLSADDIVTGTMTAGAINLGNGTFTVDSNGNLVATSASITGDITGSNISGSMFTSGSTSTGAYNVTIDGGNINFNIGTGNIGMISDVDDDLFMGTTGTKTALFGNLSGKSLYSGMAADGTGTLIQNLPIGSQYYNSLQLSSNGNILANVPNGNFQITSGGLVNTAGGSHLKNMQVDTELYVNGKLEATSLAVSGSKNSIVKTSKGWTLVNAYETAEYYFGDVGKTNTGDGSTVKVMMDSLYLETVNTSIPYHVFVSSYGNGYAWVSEQTETYFIINSSVPNLEISYEIKAKRLGYEGNRLEVDTDYDTEHSNVGV